MNACKICWFLFYCRLGLTKLAPGFSQNSSLPTKCLRSFNFKWRKGLVRLLIHKKILIHVHLLPLPALHYFALLMFFPFLIRLLVAFHEDSPHVEDPRAVECGWPVDMWGECDVCPISDQVTITKVTSAIVAFREYSPMEYGWPVGMWGERDVCPISDQVLLVLYLLFRKTVQLQWNMVEQLVCEVSAMSVASTIVAFQEYRWLSSWYVRWARRLVV